MLLNTGSMIDPTLRDRNGQGSKFCNQTAELAAFSFPKGARAPVWSTTGGQRGSAAAPHQRLDWRSSPSAPSRTSCRPWGWPWHRSLSVPLCFHPQWSKTGALPDLSIFTLTLLAPERRRVWKEAPGATTVTEATTPANAMTFADMVL